MNTLLRNKPEDIAEQLLAACRGGGHRKKLARLMMVGLFRLAQQAEKTCPELAALLNLSSATEDESPGETVSPEMLADFALHMSRSTEGKARTVNLIVRSILLIRASGILIEDLPLKTNVVQ